MDPFLGQIIMFGGNFAPRSWALCDGQLLPISSYTALFSILGTTFGGDGRTTFGLPDLRGRVPVHQGSGPGLPQVQLGQKGGAAANTLTVGNLPAHSHTAQLMATTGAAEDDGPSGNVLAKAGTEIYGTGANAQMGDDSIKVDQTGSNQPVNNMQPYQAVNYIICLQGTFPSRS